jgi:hypothetical protein
MDHARASSAEAARIQARFAEAFSAWGLALPDRAVERGEPGLVRGAGWTIRFIVGADGEGPYVEYYATHRMTSDSRARIYASGRVQELDAIWEAYVWDPKTPGDEDRARRRYLDHNRRIAAELKELGLYPVGDINAFLRTEAMPPEDPSSE